MTFPEQLRALRAEKQLTQAQAYKILQVPRRTYEDWERGIASPPEYVQRMIIKLLQQEETHMENAKQYTGYRHYIMVNKLKDSPETYEQYLRETNSGSTPEWLIKETAKRTYNYRFITNPDAMV